MNKTEFFQGLGLAPPEVEPEEIRVEGKHAKRVALTKIRRPENSAAKVASTKQENDGKAISEELQAARDEINRIDRIKDRIESVRRDIPDGVIEAERERAKHGSQQSLI